MNANLYHLSLSPHSIAIDRGFSHGSVSTTYIKIVTSHNSILQPFASMAPKLRAHTHVTDSLETQQRLELLVRCLHQKNQV